MVIRISRLLRRLRQPRSRAEELRVLRRRFGRAARSGRPGREEAAAASRLRALRCELASSFGAVRLCAGCAVGRSAPAGRFDGGHCCAGDTNDVFTDHEVAALAAGGTRPRDLHAPVSDHAGCAFRGETGCTLAAQDRPNVCVRYVCRGLSHELFGRGALDRVDALRAEIEVLFARFGALRAERVLDQEWAALVPQGRLSKECGPRASR